MGSCPTESFAEKYIFVGQKMLIDNKDNMSRTTSKSLDNNSLKGNYRRDDDLRSRINLYSGLIIQRQFDLIIKEYNSQKICWSFIHNLIVSIHTKRPDDLNDFLDYCYTKKVLFPWDDIAKFIWEPPSD